jgi:hypothetical protein
MIVGGGTRNSTVSNGNFNYVPMFNSGVFANAEATAQQFMPVAGTLSNFYVHLSGSPGNGRSFTFFVRVDGADTVVTCSVSDANTSCSDTTHSVAIGAGSLIAIRAVATGNPTARSFGWTALFGQ